MRASRMRMSSCAIFMILIYERVIPRSREDTSWLTYNSGSYMRVVLYLIEQDMRSTPVDNVHTWHIDQCFQACLDFRNHSTINDAFLNEGTRLCRIEFSKMSTISQAYAIDI